MWQTHSVRWQKKYPWLDARRRGFGCADCAANGSEASQWSTFSVLSAEALRPSGFNNHEDSAEHQGLHRATSPTKQEFLDALHAVRKGVTVLPNAGRHKVRRMRFCLGEGIRQRNVQAIVESETLGLFQDVRASRLAMRFSCCDSRLQGTRGCLGQCKVEDGSALGLRNSTLFIMMRACTPYIPPHLPEGFTIPDGYGELDEAAFEHLCQHCHCFNSDMASDEVLTGKLLQGSRDDGFRCSEHPVLPNLMARSWDRAHASRRVVSSTFELDPYLNAVVTTVVVGPGALAKRIKYPATNPIIK